MAVVKKAEELGEEAVSQVEKRRRRKEGFERAGNDAPTVPLDALPFSTRPSSTHHPSHTPMYYCPTVNFARKAI